MGEKGKMFISDYQACLAAKQGKATEESFRGELFSVKWDQKKGGL